MCPSLKLLPDLELRYFSTTIVDIGWPASRSSAPPGKIVTTNITLLTVARRAKAGAPYGSLFGTDFIVINSNPRITTLQKYAESVIILICPK